MTETSKVAGVALVAAVGCLSVAYSDDTIPPLKIAATQDFLSCVKALAKDPKFAEIAVKLPIEDANSVSFSMLADESRPTSQEQKEIADWFDERENCWKARAADIQTEWPPEVFQISNEGVAGFKAIGADLYNRKLTYGEANKRIEELRNTIKARIIPIVKQYRAEIEAQRAAASNRAAQEQEYANAETARQAFQDAQLRQQRVQLFLNYMQAVRPPPLQPLPPLPQTQAHTMNCYRNGNWTNCTGN